MTDEAISVAELHRRLRRVVEPVAMQTWIEGEVSALKRAASGHVYFCLKDEHEAAVIDCVMYRFYAQRARRFLAEGARVQLCGKATTYAPRGRLQLVAEASRPAGRGGLLEALELLKQKLNAEGLFDAARKRPLPKKPRVIGVVTSADGAAFHDICSVAFRRGGAHIVLSAALVQGDAAPASLIKALDLLEQHPLLDVIILGRGGGAIEDLMAFNDERLVRRVARCRVPVVSAVGHEIDMALTDLVADLRAATPSQAAELAVPDAAGRREALERVTRQLGRAMQGRLEYERGKVLHLRASMSDPRFMIANRQQQLDDFCMRLERSSRRALLRRRQQVEAAKSRLLQRHPRSLVAVARSELLPLAGRLASAMRLRLSRARGDLREEASRLDNLSPLSVLGRGYAIAALQSGGIIANARDVSPGDRVNVRVHAGSFEARVTKVLPMLEVDGN